jgi:uncharacterized protein
MTAVTEPGRRIVTLDVIRGIAVMGIFSVNVTAFALIFPAYMNPSAAGGHGGIDLATWFTNFVVIDGKMRSLFSILFGASMLLVIERAVAAGRPGAAVHYRRMIVLALFGLAHFYLIWFGDILFLYAVTGMIAYLFIAKRPKSLLVWAAALFLLNAATMTASSAYFRSADAAAHAENATSDQVREWNKAIAWGAQSEEKTARDTAIFRSPAGVRAEHMLTERTFEPFGSLAFFLPETLALMLLGMAGYKSGFLTGDWSDRRYRSIAFWTLSIGAAGSALIAYFTWQSNFYLPLVFFNFVVTQLPFRVMMALGYAALIILIFRKSGWIRDRFAAVGRAAFTNYLGTSIVAALVFYGDGLGLFQRLSRFEAWLVVPLVWLLMLVWSKPWLDRFNYGPFEWAWRSLSRGALQPMRKSSPPGQGGAGVSTEAKN